jgi:hypothetical protein
MALHNFIRENDMGDLDFAKYDNDEEYLVNERDHEILDSEGTDDEAEEVDVNMNAFRDELADALWADRR